MLQSTTSHLSMSLAPRFTALAASKSLLCDQRRRYRLTLCNLPEPERARLGEICHQMVGQHRPKRWVPQVRNRWGLSRPSGRRAGSSDTKKPSRPGWFFFDASKGPSPSYHRPWGGCWLRDSTMAIRMAIRLDISISTMAMGNITRT